MASNAEVLDFMIAQARGELARQVQNHADDVALLATRIDGTASPACYMRLAAGAVEIDKLTARLSGLLDARDAVAKSTGKEAA